MSLDVVGEFGDPRTVFAAAADDEEDGEDVAIAVVGLAVSGRPGDCSSCLNSALILQS